MTRDEIVAARLQSDSNDWEQRTVPDSLLGLIYARKLGSPRKWRLIAVACCRAAWNYFADDERAAIEAAEAFADGRIGLKRLASARGLIQEAMQFLLERPLSDQVAQESDYASHLHRHSRLLAAIGAATPTRKGACTAQWYTNNFGDRKAMNACHVNLIHDIFGNPFRPMAFAEECRTSTATAVAQQMYDSRDFGAMPILADALQDAGCEDAAILSHCRDAKQTHVRGCWVCDLVLGKK